jgi:hypothetical protein
MKLYMFRTVPLPIIRSLFTVHSAMVYVYKPIRHISYRSVQWINSWWWTEELSETCRVSCQNKFVKLVHLIGFVIKKFVTWTYCHDARAHERIVTMHGHMNVLSRCSTVTWTYCHDAARSHEHIVTMHGHMNVLSQCTVTWAYCHDARSH